MQLAIEARLSIPAIMLVGVVNAIGGSVLRDVLMRQEPEIFMPGTFTSTAALLSCVVFLVFEIRFSLPPKSAAWPTIVTASLIRAVSVRYNLRTHPLRGFSLRT